jgi:hypothetical protein
MVQPVQRIQFPLSEYKALKTEGSGVVTGQAFLKTRGGDVKTAAGNTVMLNPITSYSNQWYQVSYLGLKPLTELDSRIHQYVIETVADADGKFEFTKVPPGEYFVTVLVSWEAATGYQGALRNQGSWISKKINVINDETLKVILTR